MKKIILMGLLALVSLLTHAQTDTTKSATADDNFEEFGDADDNKSRTYCTQKVSYLSPTKLISIGYEGQLPFHISSIGTHGLPQVISTAETHVNTFGGLRLAVNTPVISRSSFILNLGLTYWNTRASLGNPERSTNFSSINPLNSTGINATVFKPFDNKHFLIVQASADFNGNYSSLDAINNKALTYSGTAIYGWKKNDNFMWGLGLTRTYRAGQVLHIPVVLYNRTFNQKWGVEAIVPAKVNVRRNFSPSSYLMFGYEIEGNTYFLKNSTGSDLYLRRGELKPRITFEQKLTGFIWLSVQGGLRYNWRFDAFNTQNPVKDQKPLFENTLGNPLYFNVSINLVSP
ncbi:MAG: DUF6268 family outer membrane beta-barrel protein [Rudanella sp.]|nr:DUF6268 family outer membrane beta-barrel protein [Rudanella sp.]